MNLFELFVKIGVKDEASGKLGQIAGSLGNGLKAAANVGVAAVSVAASGIAALTGAATKNYAEYEQLVGGVDTLFKDSSQKVQGYAADAYKTAGMSANEYMRTVTSFSASLIQSLEGDTEAAVEYANMAITDMSDNANKMGTDIGMIQNAYQGFAKGNFTMLDNLKLGYGGTQAEMQRLLDKANELKVAQGGLADLTIDSYADIVEAIHLVQTEMGISGITWEEYAKLVSSGAMTQEEAWKLLGTTAKEASSTIQGSVASMSASWQNLLTGIADDNANFDGLVNDFVESVSTVFENLMPRIEVALNGAASLITALAPTIFAALPQVANSLVPQLATAAVNVIQAFVSSIQSNQGTLVSTAVSISTTLINGIFSVLPQVIETGLQIVLNLIIGISSALPDLIPAAVSMVMQIVSTLANNLELLIDAALALTQGLAQGLISALPILAETVPQIVVTIVTTIFENLPLVLDMGLQIIFELISGILQALPELGQAAFNIVDGLIRGLIDAWPNIISNFEGLINTLISAVKNILGIHSPSTVFAGIGGNVASGFGNGFEGIWGGIQANIVSKIQSLVAKAKQAAAEIQEALQEANAEVGNVLADNGTVNSGLEAAQARGKTAAGTTNNYYINSSKQTATEIVKETKYINNRAVMTQ